MKNLKRVLAVIITAAMLIPLAVTTSFASIADPEDNWTLFGAMYDSNYQMIRKNPGDPPQSSRSVMAPGFDITSDQNGVITLYTPNNTQFGVRRPGSLSTSLIMATNENVTPLDNLSVTVKPGNGFYFTQVNGTSCSLFFLWSIEHPITLEDVASSTASNLADLPYATNVQDIYGDGLRWLVPLPYTDDQGVEHAGATGLGAYVDNIGASAIADRLVANRVMIYKFDGSFCDKCDDKYGYRWTFTAMNFEPQTNQGNSTGIYTYNERVDCTDGLTFNVVPDSALGYKVYVNGKDFSNGLEVSAFPNNVILNNPPENDIAKHDNYINSMTYARANLDLSSLVGAGNGYLTVGSTGHQGKANSMSMDIVAVNGVPAAEWEGEANDTTHVHNWVAVVDIDPSCYVPGVHVYQCACGAVKNTQWRTYEEHEPAWIVQDQLKALREQYAAEGRPLEGEEYIAARNEILMQLYYATTDALKHEFIVTTLVEPTCTEAGIVQKVCDNNCGLEPVVEAVPALGHIWSSWEFNSDHTELSRVCARCESVQTETIPVNGTYDAYWKTSARNWVNWTVSADDPDFETLYGDLSNNDKYSVVVGSNGEITLLDSAASYGTALKFPITKAMAKFSTPLDGFSVTTRCVQGEINEMPVNTYSMSYLWTNRPDKYDDADEYSTTITNPQTLDQARFGFLMGEYARSEYDLCITLLDYLTIDNENDGNPDLTIGVFGDGYFDAITYGIVVDGVGRVFNYAPIRLAQDDDVDLSLAYANGSVLVYINENEPLELDAGEQLITDGYYFGAAAYGITPTDYVARPYTPVLGPSTTSASFTISSICGQSPVGFIGTGHLDTSVHEHTAGEWTVVNAADCTEAGEEALYCTECGELLETRVIPALGHDWGEWVITTPATVTTDGSRTRTCSRCSATETEVIPALGLDWELDNYVLVIHNAAEANYVRIAPGVHTTSSAIRNAEGVRNMNASVLATLIDANGDLRIDLLYLGQYSMWIRFNDQSTFIVSDISVEPANITPVAVLNGLTFTISSICGEAVSDIHISRGFVESYRDAKNNKIVRLSSFTGESMSDYDRTTKYQVDYRALPEDGNFTVYVRYNDSSRAHTVYQFHIDYPQPEVIVHGLQTTVTDLIGIKVIRVAPGTYATSGEVKRADGVKNYSAKSVIKGNESYTIQFANDGDYTLSIEYTSGYAKIVTVHIQHLAPTITPNGNTLTFSDLDCLYVIRYAPGRITKPGYIKTTEGNKVVKPSRVEPDGTFTTEALSGIWTFLVQYDDNSQNLFTYDFTNHQFVN